MSRPVNIWCPCNGDAHEEMWAWDWDPSCENCTRYEVNHGACLGDRGWPILAYTAAEVARERGQQLRTHLNLSHGGTVTNVTVCRAGTDPSLVRDDWGWTS